MKTHPHAEASYRIVPLPDGTFGVEVSIPETYPTTVSSFDSEEAAEAWIAKNKERVQSESAAGGWFRKSGQRPPPQRR
ncbi:MAG: hypothetical protein ACM3JG_15615 [Thiohalocapsa sp.]